MSNRFIRKKVVDIVGQCGLPVTPRDDIISETGGMGFRLPRCGIPGRFSRPLPLHSVYRITHIPAPPPTDAAQVYVTQHLDNLENTKLEYSYHPTMHINSSVTVFRPRLPILCMKEPLQDQIYKPSTFEEKDLVELPSEAVKARTLSARTQRLNEMRPNTARTMTFASPMQIHEPNFPSPSLTARPRYHSARAERPNSNASDFDDELTPKNISMKKLEAPPIDPKLMPKEIDPEELKQLHETEYTYYEKNDEEEEVKEPPDRKSVV